MLFGVAAPGIFKLFMMESLRNMASDGRSRCLKSILKTHSFLDPDTQKKIRKVSFAPEMDVLVFTTNYCFTGPKPSTRPSKWAREIVPAVSFPFKP